MQRFYYVPSTTATLVAAAAAASIVTRELFLSRTSHAEPAAEQAQPSPSSF